MKAMYSESSCCGNNDGNIQCLQEIPACNIGCSDDTKLIEAACVEGDVITGVPLVDTHAKYLDLAACRAYFNAVYPYPVAFTTTNNIYDPHGCFRKISDTSSKGYFNDHSGSGTCTYSKPCIQKTDNTWTGVSGASAVEAGQICIDGNNKIVVKGLLDAFDFSNNNQITFKKHLIPEVNSQYDLGSAEYKVRYLFETD
tara:strand:- start:9764 stop:10357 length:594 start_codon:yes stop_codon:yes gene_type:complete